MNLEFNIFKLRVDSPIYQKWSNDQWMNKDIDKEFIVVGEEDNIGDKIYIKIIPLENDGVCLVGGLKLSDLGYLVDEKDVYYTSMSAEFDIDRKYLSFDDIEIMQKTNERLIKC
jgi:hypothetical protein